MSSCSSRRSLARVAAMLNLAAKDIHVVTIASEGANFYARPYAVVYQVAAYQEPPAERHLTGLGGITTARIRGADAKLHTAATIFT